MTDRNKASELQDYLVENGVSEGSILNHIINNYLSGAEALVVLQSVLKEFLDEEDADEDYEDEVDGSSWRESEDFFDEDEEDYNSALLYGVDNNQ